MSRRRFAPLLAVFVPAIACSGASTPHPSDAGLDVQMPGDASNGGTLGGCPLFPADHVVNTPVVGAPVHARSSAFVTRMRSVSGAHPRVGASSLVWGGSRAGIPVNVGGVARTLLTDGSYGSAIGAFTTVMPTVPRIEGEPNPLGAWDQHVLTVDPATCMLTEVIQYRYDATYGYLVSGGVVWDLRAYAPPVHVVAGSASAEAAGLPIAPLLFRYDEVAAGNVPHAIRIASDAIANANPLWPATRTDGRDATADAMPMGARLRLRSSVDLTPLGAQARVIARAMQLFGLVVADSTPDGGGWVIVGEGDARWDDTDLATLTTLDLADFEVVDLETYRVPTEAFRTQAP